MAGMGSVLKARNGACATSLRIIMSFVIVLLLGIQSAHSQKLYFQETDLNILVDDTKLVKLIQVGQFNTSLAMTAVIQHPDILQVVPQTIDIPGSKEPNSTVVTTHDVSVYAKSPGNTEITFNSTPAGFVNENSVYLRVTVMHSHIIKVVSYIMGWIYFAAWSVSFYPQIYINFKRKSVVGLNFDFVSLNIVGFIMYSMFNCALYFSKEIQDEYFARHPRGLNPVHLNDVFFSMHAAFATFITIVQCFIYERADQRVSTSARGILGVFACVVLVSAGLGGAGKLAWLDFLYYCSYIKLSITLIKYVPQAYMNYKRKSTVGWSIGNIFLDFIGGFLSVLQMVLNGYNYNDWASFFGDFTKFGLGLFSLSFDIFFMLQHYVFYRGARYIRLAGTTTSTEDLTHEVHEPSEQPYQGAPT
ncbi:lysosomal cystine transporter cystinosin isoform X2 [Anticarsia gemmatalis]|uniref:lysosomal cystine transporter cystinosin isoform X2 n=1 Tax=Anticarsia gemmatalis TaxID=129554 RepID=UPI003F7727ED